MLQNITSESVSVKEGGTNETDKTVSKTYPNASGKESDSGAWVRAFYVLVGLSLIVVIYFVIKSVR